MFNNFSFKCFKGSEFREQLEIVQLFATGSKLSNSTSYKRVLVTSSRE